MAGTAAALAAELAVRAELQPGAETWTIVHVSDHAPSVITLFPALHYNTLSLFLAMYILPTGKRSIFILFIYVWTNYESFIG